MPDVAAPEERFVEIAKVGRPHGVRGELRVFPLNLETEALYEGAALRWTKGRKHKDVTIEAMRPAKGLWLVRLEGLASREDVAVLNGGMLSVPRSSLPAPEEGEVYVGDLVGLTVIDEASAAELGTVQRIGESNVEVLDIRLARGGVVLVPFIKQYVGEIDLTAGTIAIRDIDHWIDL